MKERKYEGDIGDPSWRASVTAEERDASSTSQTNPLLFSIETLWNPTGQPSLEVDGEEASFSYARCSPFVFCSLLCCPTLTLSPVGLTQIPTKLREWDSLKNAIFSYSESESFWNMWKYHIPYLRYQGLVTSQSYTCWLSFVIPYFTLVFWS